MSLVNTVGGATSNSYPDVAYADAYFSTRAGASDWVASTDTATKESCLITATWRIDQETAKGYRASATQRLSWPRLYVPDPDGAPTATYLDGASIPRAVLEAVCELALVLFRSTSDWLKPGALEAFSQLSIPGISLTPAPSAPRPGALPDVVLRLLSGLLVASDGGSYRLIRS